jgi:hypothetical protein
MIKYAVPINLKLKEAAWRNGTRSVSQRERERERAVLGRDEAVFLVLQTEKSHIEEKAKEENDLFSHRNLFNLLIF